MGNTISVTLSRKSEGGEGRGGWCSRCPTEKSNYTIKAERTDLRQTKYCLKAQQQRLNGFGRLLQGGINGRKCRNIMGLLNSLRLAPFRVAGTPACRLVDTRTRTRASMHRFTIDAMRGGAAWSTYFMVVLRVGQGEGGLIFIE